DENQSAREHDRKHHDTHDADEYFESHPDLRVAAANARMDGTQRPTKIPASFSTKNHSTTENTKEMKAATKNSVSGQLVVRID
ncbi:MAG TPA: hypothetical protein VK845_14185, partial [Gemmatimonadales bacterium]|nr:hypothetical protein [Gemmatimonadales bacterium]